MKLCLHCVCVRSTARDKIYIKARILKYKEYFDWPNFYVLNKLLELYNTRAYQYFRRILKATF